MIDIAVLRAAGLSDSEIVRVLEVEQKERKANRKNQNRINQQNHRARHHVSNYDADCADTPSPPSSFSPIPPHITTPPSCSSLRSESVNDGWPNDFREQFWNAYPRKVAKKDAIRALEKVRRGHETTFATLLNAVARIDTKDPQFIPHPATWLNRGSYLDDPPTGHFPKPMTIEEYHRTFNTGGRKNGKATEGSATDQRRDRGADHGEKLLPERLAFYSDNETGDGPDDDPTRF